MSKPGTILEVEDLCVAYGKVEALHHVNIKVGEGQIVTVIGPNGAGKTTMLSSIMGVLPHTRGVIRFQGEEVGDAEVEQMVALGINLVPESRALFGEMSVEDNPLLGAFMRHRMGHRDHGQTMEEVFQIFPRLKERRMQHAGTLSGGERQMLAVGRALMTNGRLILLDEPSMGLSPLLVQNLFKTLHEINQSGITLLLVEQNANLALKYASRAYVLETGNVVLEGSAAEISRNPLVKKAYLGG